MGRVKEMMIQFEESLNYLTNLDLAETLKSRLHTEVKMNEGNEEYERDLVRLLKALDDYMEWESVYGRKR